MIEKKDNNINFIDIKKISIMRDFKSKFKIQMEQENVQENITY